MKNPEIWSLANGLQVLYQQDAGFPLAQGTLILGAGSRREKHTEAGLASMTIDLLAQGTRKRNARAIARTMESVGASLGSQGHEDYAEMDFIVPASDIAKSLDVLAEVLIEPTFPPEEVTKEKAHVLASLASRRDAIFNLAYDFLNRALFGDHPYGRPLEGEESSVRNFKRMDFRRWHADAIRPEGAILSIIGPMSSKDLRARLNNTLGHWRSSSPAYRVNPLPAVPSLKRSIAQKIPSSFEQAYLMRAWQAPSAHHADQVPIRVLNTLLGGGMSSRLFLTLREKLSLAYEVSSFYPTRLDRSLWVVYLGLPKEKIKIASQKLQQILANLADHGPQAAELAQAKAMIRGAFLMDRQSRRRQAWYNAWWKFLGRGPGYAEEFLAAVDTVSAKTIQKLMQHLLAQPTVTVTVVPK